MAELDWDKLVEERNAWVAHNFPNSGEPLTSVLGVIEELGELTHHHLKMTQSIRGSADFHETETRDAIGDLTVYLLGVMNHYSVRPTGVLEWDGNLDQVVLKLAETLGELAGDELAEHDSWMHVNVSVAVSLMRLYCQKRGWSYDATVQVTWNKVKQRDWIKFPNNGLDDTERHDPTSA